MNGTQGSKLAASSRAAKIGSSTLGASASAAMNGPAGWKFHSVGATLRSVCARPPAVSTIIGQRAARRFDDAGAASRTLQIDLGRIVVHQPVERAAKTPGHHRGIERRRQEPRRQRRAPMRHRLGDQRMAPRGERPDFGGNAIEGRCVGEIGLGRKPTRKPIRSFRWERRPVVPAIVGHRAAAGGADQTGRHAGAALHRGLQLAPRHRQVARFRK